MSKAFYDTKPHYEILDALRGVAALMVVWYHIYEGYAFACGAPIINGLNHGYLAVDFFFILSGFVLSYAYDDRWGKGFTVGKFLKRRLIRLHPMVIMGALIGAAAFLIQGSVQWDGTHIAISAVMIALLCTMFMIPVVPGSPYEVRGNGEMFPLNGPSWSLFFEYIGNIIYALIIRRLPNKALAVLCAVLGIALGVFTVTDPTGSGCLSVGWTLDNMNFLGGLLRMLFPFTAGMLIARTFKPIKIKGAFWICSIILIAIFAIPYIPSADTSRISLNGVFEIACIILVFPALLWIAASDNSASTRKGQLYRVLGDLSYPLYITHYPVMYLFYSWMIQSGRYTAASTWAQSILVYAVCVILATVCLKFYDAPLRSRLARKKK